MTLISSAADLGFTLLAFLLMISVIVTIHEWGHYRSARWFGLIGTHFSIGFGKKIFGWTDKNGTEWRIAPILLGGYVKFPGDSEQPLKLGQKTLDCLPRWQRAIVVAAGPIINLLFAGLIFSVIAYSYGYPAGRPIIQQIVAGSPAQAAGLLPGDEITHVNGHKIVTSADVIQRIKLYPDSRMLLGFNRDAKARTISANVRSELYDDGLGNQGRVGFLGVKLATSIQRAPSIGAAITQGISDGVFATYAQITSLQQIVTGQRSLTEMSGPIRIAKMSSHTLSLGLMPFLYMMAMLSIAVGIMNLLPIPGLDGGHLATFAIEGTIGRPVPTKLAKSMLKAGFAVIIGLGLLGLTLDYLALS